MISSSPWKIYIQNYVFNFFKRMELRIAIVAYRDYKQNDNYPPQFEISDFTNDI